NGGGNRQQGVRPRQCNRGSASRRGFGQRNGAGCLLLGAQRTGGTAERVEGDGAYQGKGRVPGGAIVSRGDRGALVSCESACRCGERRGGRTGCDGRCRRNCQSGVIARKGDNVSG